MFKEINISDLEVNPFEAVGKQWMLITAGNSEKCNTMTASWGAMGVIWNKNTATCYVRPQRYTREFIDSEEYFSLSFLPEDSRAALSLCGSVSGRDCDKIKDAGLTALFDCDAPYFAESELILICRKLYKGEIAPEGFIDPAIDGNYAQKDYHYIYIGEIVKALVKLTGDK
ncbi:MAG: flavin reductase [Oscillospiraceae bacterium]|nr:flavin reductase [Oscillospiraceae bacterium]